ncbi:MAG TPA: LLM class flavin-dependent oxidoreductase [Myxococcota bacterium]|nr:LLM class flavin-dependent oxidoreductase [Myxococcota bacterium]
MRLRLGVHYEGLPGPNDYAGLVAHAREAERLGFESLWVGERPDPAAQGIPAALLVCAALAAATERVRIGTAVLPLPLYHPLRVAEDAATLDGLSEGRFDLGVGLGDDPAGHHGFGVPPEERASRLEEGLAILAQALGGSAVEFTGRHFQIAGVRVAPPAVQPGGPPIFLGAHAEVAVRRAVRLGCGLVATEPAAASLYLSAWREAGRDPEGARIVLRVGRDADSDLLRALAADLAGAGRLDLVLPAGADLAALAHGGALRSGAR